MFHTLLKGMVLYFLKVGRESTAQIIDFPRAGVRKAGKRDGKVLCSLGMGS